jgi:hypothetical protein
VTITIPKPTAARVAAVIAAAAVIAMGALIGAYAGSASRPTATALAKRDAKPAAMPGRLSTARGAKICRDLNGWLTGAWSQAKPRFTNQMQFDESNAGYSALGNDLMTLDWNLVNFSSGALKNSLPNHYPVTGLTALQHDCAGYSVTINTTSG